MTVGQIAVLTVVCIVTHAWAAWMGATWAVQQLQRHGLVSREQLERHTEERARE